MNRPQNSDRFTLEQALQGMRDLGNATEEYIQGYADHFRGGEILFSSQWTDDQHRAYKRGRKTARDAEKRGAHREAG